MARRGVVRRSLPHRRAVRIRLKSDAVSYVRRFKLLNFLPTDPMPLELKWELEVLDRLEQLTYEELKTQGVSEDLWQYYLGFNKRLWERAVDFNDQTFLLEKTTLIQEYVLRGLDKAILDALQDIGEYCASAKRLGYWPPIGPEASAWAYYSVTGVQIVEWGSYVVVSGVNISEIGGGGYFNRS